MLKAAWLIARKDLCLVMARGGAWVQSLLLGLLLVFVFSLALPPGAQATAQTAATLFWLASAFCQVLAFNMLYALEDPTRARSGLRLAPVPVQAVWLGKALCGLILLVAAQVVFFPALMVFLAQPLGPGWPLFLALLALTDLGLAGLGSLLGSLAPGQAARESLLSVIIFPVLVPLLLAGIRGGEAAFAPALPEGLTRWIGLAAAYDAVFLGAALLLFPFVFGDDR